MDLPQTINVGFIAVIFRLFKKGSYSLEYDPLYHSLYFKNSAASLHINNK